MNRYIRKELRKLIVERAGCLCEYCLLPDVVSMNFQVDHVISIKHGGSSTEQNLCYSCIYCNVQKGSDLGSINWRTGELVRFFNPCRDKWSDHFRLDGAIIQPLTDIGEVTARIFDFNHQERVIERQMLIEFGAYPPPPALERINKDN
ncbi:HNH endonuclease [Calothrix sp. NIES-4071]|nr:HNH endonuclease [Calothrix sp. NIES-4071]BAZ63667.1 HNH endonuclease [Calothrix sp. NIES-4105]